MNNMVRDMRNDNGTIDTMYITSDDNYKINLGGKYKLANCNYKKNIKESFQNSIFGADIGINSKGFANVFIISTIIAVLSFVMLYFSWRV